MGGVGDYERATDFSNLGATRQTSRKSFCIQINSTDHSFITYLTHFGLDSPLTTPLKLLHLGPFLSATKYSYIHESISGFSILFH